MILDGSMVMVIRLEGDPVERSSNPKRAEKGKVAVLGSPPTTMWYADMPPALISSR